jgi:hypothetical protein
VVMRAARPRDRGAAPASPLPARRSGSPLPSRAPAPPASPLRPRAPASPAPHYPLRSAPPRRAALRAHRSASATAPPRGALPPTPPHRAVLFIHRPRARHHAPLLHPTMRWRLLVSTLFYVTNRKPQSRSSSPTATQNAPVRSDTCHTPQRSARLRGAPPARAPPSGAT